MENEELDLGAMLFEYSKTIEPKLPVTLEFRLYYRDDGSIITYSCEELDGNYIVVDAEIFALGRQDIRVIDGKIQIMEPTFIVTKLIEADNGISCAAEDISIPVSDDHEGDSKKWEIKQDEFKFN